MSKKKASWWKLLSWPVLCLFASLPMPADAGQKYDFNENKLNKEVWSNEQGSATIKNGILLIPKDNDVISKEQYLFEDLEIRVKWSEKLVGGGDATWAWRKGPPWDNFFVGWRYNQGGLVAEKDDGKGRVASQNLNVDAQKWHNYKIEWISKKKAKWYIDGELVWEQDSIMDVARPVLLNGYHPVGNMEVDLVIIGEAPPEAVQTAGKLTIAWGKLKAE